MDFFQNYSKYNESLNIEETNKKLIDVDDELKKDDANFNKILRKMLKVITKSEILDNNDIKSHISDIYQKLAEKVGKSDKKEEIEKNPKYINLKAFVDAYEKNENENALKIAAQGKEIIRKEEEEKAKKEAEEKAKEPKKEESSSKMSDEDKKALADKFKAASVTNVSAPLLSMTNNKSKEANKALQLFLLKNGYYPTTEALDESSPKADGDLGTVTAAAIKAYQADKGLKADGVVGTQTWKAILNDINFGIDNDKFKAIKPEVSASSDKKEETKKEETTTTNTTATKVEIVYDDALPQVTPIDKIVEVLTSQQLSSATYDTDELKVAKLLIGQCLVKGITAANGKDLLAKYKEKNNNGDLVKDLLYAFDSENVTTINTKYKSIVQSKDNFEYITKMNWLKISNGNSLADQTKNLSLVFIAFAQTKSKELIDSMTANKVDVNLINQINAIVPKTETKPAETKTETKPAEKTAAPAQKTEAPKVEL